MSQSIESIKRTLEALPSQLVNRAQHDAIEKRIEGLAKHVDDQIIAFNRRLDEQSPTGLIQHVTRWASGITAIGGAGALFWLLFERFHKGA